MAVQKAILEEKVDVLVKPDCITDTPDLWLSVYVADDDESEQRAFAEWLVRGRCYKAKDIDNADLVIFTGGADVDPALYGEACMSATCFEPDRDERDIEIYHKCYADGIPMLGVCRGAQFGAVMNGGKLYQDVEGHIGAHQIWDNVEKRLVDGVSSVHHQMVIPHEGMDIIATSVPGGHSKWKNKREFTTKGPEVEVFFYRDSCFLGIQGHPEYRNYPVFSEYCLHLIENYVNYNPDLVNKDGVIRLKDSVMESRRVADKIISIAKGKKKK